MLPMSWIFQAYKRKTEAAKKEYLKALAAYRASLVSKVTPWAIGPAPDKRDTEAHRNGQHRSSWKGRISAVGSLVPYTCCVPRSCRALYVHFVSFNSSNKNPAFSGVKQLA